MPSNGLNFQMDWRYAFNIDPARKGRVGYLMSYKGCGLELKKDIEVYNPMEDSKLIKCTAIIDHFSFGGGVADPINLSCFMSTENALQLKALFKSTVKTTKLTFSYYIVDFDDESSKWYEAADQKDNIIDANINSKDGNLMAACSDNPEKIAPNIDTNVYNFNFEAVPAANKTFALKFAVGSTTRYVKNWGFKLGK